jgi:hypothetical protein
MLVCLVAFGVYYRGEAVFRAERFGVVFWSVIAPSPLVGFCFVDEEGYAWLFGCGVQMSH